MSDAIVATPLINSFLALDLDLLPLEACCYAFAQTPLIMSSQELPYHIFAGSPTPPSSVWHTVTQDYVNLNWNSTSDTDCSMVMITVGDKYLLNASHQVGTATLDISEYRSKGSIVIEMYGINKCGMMSNRSTKEAIKIGRYINIQTIA
jgi:hypothetical protein